MVEEREKMRECDGIYTFSFLSFNLVGDWVMLFSGSTGIQDSDALNRITLNSNMDNIPQSHRILLYPVSTADSGTPSN